jgi:hypothetical protein
MVSNTEQFFLRIAKIESLAKKGLGTQINETTGDTTTWHGVFVVIAENGDKIHYAYASSGMGMLKDGQFQS